MAKTILSSKFVNPRTRTPFRVLKENPNFLLALDDDADPTNPQERPYYIIFIPNQTVEASMSSYMLANHTVDTYEKQYEMLNYPVTIHQQEPTKH